MSYFQETEAAPIIMPQRDQTTTKDKIAHYSILSIALDASQLANKQQITAFWRRKSRPRRRKVGACRLIVPSHKRLQRSSYNHIADIRKSAYIWAFGRAWAIDILFLFSRIEDNFAVLESDLK